MSDTRREDEYSIASKTPQCRVVVANHHYRTRREEHNAKGEDNKRGPEKEREREGVQVITKIGPCIYICPRNYGAATITKTKACIAEGKKGTICCL